MLFKEFKTNKWMAYFLAAVFIFAVTLFLLITFKFFTGDFVDNRESDPESITIQPDSFGLTSCVRTPPLCFLKPRRLSQKEQSLIKFAA